MTDTMQESGEARSLFEFVNQGLDGALFYLVQWEDSGHEGLFFPDPDAVVQQFTRRKTGGPGPKVA